MTDRQRIFVDLVAGTLSYAVVLGFLNDYTDLVWARSFSTIFLASVVLAILTWLTLRLKTRVLGHLRGREGGSRRALIGFVLWQILFWSKFVFLWVLETIFGDDIRFSGFFGILAPVILVTIIIHLGEVVFTRLGEPRAAAT
jgi:hypothetical protein